MLKKTIKYVDYNDMEREEDFYFNLNKAEIMEMELGVKGGLDEFIKKVVATTDGPELIKLFKKFILDSYGKKAPDGLGFIKSEELKTAFEQHPAYPVLYMELATDADAASNFLKGIIPKDLDIKSVDPSKMVKMPRYVGDTNA